jgi:hypothetical protein
MKRQILGIAAVIAGVVGIFALLFGGLYCTEATAARKKPSPAYPLHYGNRGVRVKDAQWLMAGHNRYHFRIYTGKIDGVFGSQTMIATCRAKWRFGYPTTFFQDKGHATLAKCRQFGRVLRSYMLPWKRHTAAHKLPSNKWRWRVRLRIPPKKPPKPKLRREDKIINGVVSGAWWGYRHGGELHYTQGSYRWSAFLWHVNAPPQLVRYADCSSWVSYLYYHAMRAVMRNPPDVLNHLFWRAGYTGTLASHGQHVYGTPHRGDLVLYGYGFPYSHVAVYVGSGHVISQGGEDGPRYLPWTYRSVAQVRRYVS